MNIAITQSAKSLDHPWQVRLDQHVVSFRTEKLAMEFVSTLQARIRAPHALPQGAYQRMA